MPPRSATVAPAIRHSSLPCGKRPTPGSESHDPGGVPDLINDGAPFRFDQRADLGLSRKELEHLIEVHAVRRVFYRVYVASGVPESRDLRIRALHLVMPPAAVLFGSTAAWVLGVDTFAPADRFLLEPACVVPHGSSRCRTRGVRCVEGFIPESDVMELDGLRLTGPVRTAADLLRGLRRPYALSAADSMAHAGLVSAEEVRRYIQRLKGYPGIVQARELAELIEPRHESGGETWQNLRLRDAGYPPPEPQYRVYDHRDRLIARLDHAYPLLRIGIEYDGAEFHDHDEDQDDDEMKRAYLRGTLGWRIIINRKDDILGKDDSFEREVGEYLGLVPELPRMW
jgi:hypothetical protein